MRAALASILVLLASGCDAPQAGPPTSGPAPDLPAVEALLGRLDRAFDQRDLDGYLDGFAAENGQLRRVLKERLRAVFSGVVQLERRSSVERFTTMRGRGVALVRSDTRVADTREDPRRARVNLEEYAYLVTRLDGSRAVGSFMVEVDESHLGAAAASRFRCPECNYEVNGADAWLAVPHRRDRTDCMEAVSFYLLGADLSLDLSVYIDADRALAGPALRDYLTRLAGTDAVEVSPWTPPAHRANAPAELSGATGTLLLEGRASRHFLVTLGKLRYLMVLSGDAEALASAPAKAILESFRILDLSISLDRLAAMPISAHAGGSWFDGNTFHNPGQRVSLEGPAGWNHSLGASGPLFEVTFRCPQGRARLWVNAHGPQPGLDSWSTELADSWLESYCRTTGMETLRSEPWGEPSRGFRQRTVHTRPPPDSVGAAAAPRMIRLAVADDLLVVLHGYVNDPWKPAILEETFASLRRDP